MSTTKGSSSNDAGDGPSFCDACGDEHHTNACPSCNRGRDSDHSDCQPFVPQFNPTLGMITM